MEGLEERAAGCGVGVVGWAVQEKAQVPAHPTFFGIVLLSAPLFAVY